MAVVMVRSVVVMAVMMMMMIVGKEKGCRRRDEGGTIPRKRRGGEMVVCMGGVQGERRWVYVRREWVGGRGNKEGCAFAGGLDAQQKRSNGGRRQVRRGVAPSGSK